MTPRDMLVLARFSRTSLSEILAWPVRRIVRWIRVANDLADEIRRARESE